MRKTYLLAAAVLVVGILGGCTKGAGQTPQTTEATSKEATSEASSEVTETEPVKAQAESEAQAADAQAYRKTPDPAAANGSRFLFVGNSHTYVNDLPSIFYELSAAAGHEAEVYDVTAGSYTLKGFSDPQDEYGAIVVEALGTEPWDFVILQDNTNSAMDAEQAMYPYARKLDGMARDAGAQTAFLMTWAPKDGAGAFSRAMVQTMLSKSYTSIASELDALLIPGGDLFSYALELEPGLELWGEDGQHPSVEGTYLAACGAYALFFQETPVGNPYLCGLDQETAGKLQEIAQNYMLE